MTDLLMVSYHFPPYGGGAVARIHGFAKYLPEFGYRPTVLTVLPDYYESLFLDQTLEREYSGSVQIVRTRSLEPRATAVKDKVLSRAEGSTWDAAKRTVLRFIDRHFLIPDRQLFWKPFAIREGRRLLRAIKPAAVFATVPVPTNVSVAFALSKKGRIPLIVDYRDLWIANPFFRNRALGRDTIEKWLERRWLSQAAAIITTTKEARAKLKDLYPQHEHKILHIPNGFDPDRYPSAPRQRRPAERIRFTYMGALTANRTPRFFLRALSSLLDDYPHFRGLIEVRFFGFTAAPHVREISELGLSEIVKVCGFADSQRAAQILREETDVALLFQRHVDGGETAVPGKLYEYLAAGCVVLAMCDGGATANLLNSLNVGLVTSYEDVRAIAAAIRDSIDAVQRDPARHVISENVLRRFDRRELSRDLAALINRVVPKGKCQSE